MTRRGALLVTIMMVALPAAAGCAGRTGGNGGTSRGIEPGWPGATAPGATAPGITAPGAIAPGVTEEALAGWRDFPVDRVPRPIVLFSPAASTAGFRTDGAKIAAGTGRFELTVPLPDATRATVPVALPDGTHQLPLIPAAEAFARLKATGNPGNAPDASPPPLRITKVELGTAAFLTDRGQQSLPAWLFHSPDALEPLGWVALGPEAFWSLEKALQPAFGGSENTVKADGLRLSISMPAPPPPCPGTPIRRYVPERIESTGAVAVGVREEETGSVAPGKAGECVSDLMMRYSLYEFTLAAPLGNRVVVDGRGNPIPVTPSR
jgi:hypothetical protein